MKIKFYILGCHMLLFAECIQQTETDSNDIKNDSFEINYEKKGLMFNKRKSYHNKPAVHDTPNKKVRFQDDSNSQRAIHSEHGDCAGSEHDANNHGPSEVEGKESIANPDDDHGLASKNNKNESTVNASNGNFGIIDGVFKDDLENKVKVEYITQYASYGDFGIIDGGFQDNPENKAKVENINPEPEGNSSTLSIDCDADDLNSLSPYLQTPLEEIDLYLDFGKINNEDKESYFDQTEIKQELHDSESSENRYLTDYVHESQSTQILEDRNEGQINPEEINETENQIDQIHN